MSLSPGHLRYHGRFYASVATGVLAWIAASQLAPAVRLSVAGDGFFALYLLLSWIVGRRLTPDDLRAKAQSDDEGIVVIVIIALAAIVVSLGSLLMLLREGGGDPADMAPALVAVPLGWCTLHTILAFHYAHLFYARDDSGGDSPAGGLAFPDGNDEPSLLDFMYYAFVVGMTAQVSDIDTVSRDMRLATLIHSVVSFFFNTVIVALMVNVAVSKGG